MLDRVDPILATPIELTPAEFSDLVAFVRDGLRNPRANADDLRRLIPATVPSGRAVPVFR